MVLLERLEQGGARGGGGEKVGLAETPRRGQGQLGWQGHWIQEEEGSGAASPSPSLQLSPAPPGACPSPPHLTEMSSRGEEGREVLKRVRAEGTGASG